MGVASPATDHARRSPSSPRSQSVACTPPSSLATAAKMPGITAPTDSPVASAAAISAIAVSVRGIDLEGRALCDAAAGASDTASGRGRRMDKMTEPAHLRRARTHVATAPRGRFGTTSWSRADRSRPEFRSPRAGGWDSLRCAASESRRPGRAGNRPEPSNIDPRAARRTVATRLV
jgi:hypothetical protein